MSGFTTENELLNSEIARNVRGADSYTPREIRKVEIYRKGELVEWASDEKEAEEIIAYDMDDEKAERSEYITKIIYYL